MLPFFFLTLAVLVIATGAGSVNGTAMSFSSAFPITREIYSFSFDGKYLAYATQNQLVVRFTGNYELFHSFSCVDILDGIEWSPDAQYILASVFKRATVHVFSMESPGWRCKLKDPDAGIIDAFWTPDSRQIFTMAEFHVSLSVWSLTCRSVSYINQPKATVVHKDSFSPNGKWCAIVECDGKREQITVFCAISWQCALKITDMKIQNVGGIKWSPCSTIFCIWSSLFSECNLNFYSVIAKKWIAHYEPMETEKCFGVKMVSWPLSGQFIAVSGYDSCLRILQHITWQCIAQFDHANILTEREYTIFEETHHHNKPSFEEITKRPVAISTSKQETTQHVATGIGLSKFSKCGRYLASRDDKIPAVLWIWDMQSFQLISVLIHKHPVTSAEWDPRHQRLAITSASDTLSFWSIDSGVKCMKVPSHCLGRISVTGAQWHPASGTLALSAGDKLVVLKL